MFYSTELLSFRGGKFSTIWLLGTCRDKKQTANKKRQELKKLKLHRICEELTKLLPVQGKERSLSLRLSASLLYGTCLAYRFQADYLHRSHEKLKCFIRKQLKTEALKISIRQSHVLYLDHDYSLDPGVSGKETAIK